MEIKAKAFQNECAKEAKDFWKQNAPLNEGVAKALIHVASSTGLDLTIGKMPEERTEGGFLGVFSGTNKVICSEDSIKLMEEYAKMYPTFIEIGIKFAVRHEYWHTQVSNNLAARYMRKNNIALNKDSETLLEEIQVWKKTMKEITSVFCDSDLWRKLNVELKVKRTNDPMDLIKFQDSARIIANGLLFTSCVREDIPPRKWIEEDLGYKLSRDNRIFSFLNDNMLAVVKVEMDYAIEALATRIGCNFWTEKRV